MYPSTLNVLKCPQKTGKHLCAGTLLLQTKKKSNHVRAGEQDILEGTISCSKCHSRYPILAGIAVLVPDVRAYLMEHVKGISRWVTDQEIPSEFRREFLEMKQELYEEHIEEDLEAERVNALYLMTHYLSTQSEERWWNPSQGTKSTLIENTILQHWDAGPFSTIAQNLQKHGPTHPSEMVELGCGVGGLLSVLKPHLKRYLGVDSSFASIALARHLNLQGSHTQSFDIPEDLLAGTISRKVQVKISIPESIAADFFVGDIAAPPLQESRWDLCTALNVMDMLDSPEILPKIQSRLLKSNGYAIQSCPYIWHAQVARTLRKKLPKTIRTSQDAVEWLYKQEGFSIPFKTDQLPWLFFKHVRQLEIYSVHLLFAKK